MGGHYFQNRKGPIIWIGVGISVIDMSPVLRRMGGAALSSIITPAKPYRWVSLSTTPDDTLMICQGFFFRYDAKPEIMFISLRKIAAGEEIVFDYRHLYKGVLIVCRAAPNASSFTKIILPFIEQ